MGAGVSRTELPPSTCPVCGRARATWTTYRLFTDVHGECCGCGSCGYVAYLSKRPAFAVFIVEPDGTVTPATPAPEVGEKTKVRV